MPFSWATVNDFQRAATEAIPRQTYLKDEGGLDNEVIDYFLQLASAEMAAELSSIYESKFTDWTRLENSEAQGTVPLLVVGLVADLAALKMWKSKKRLDPDHLSKFDEALGVIKDQIAEITSRQVRLFDPQTNEKIAFDQEISFRIARGADSSREDDRLKSPEYDDDGNLETPGSWGTDV